MTAKDHKRKAVAIAPATVTVRDGEIIVVVPDVLGKNASHWVPPSKGGRRIISKQTVAYRASMQSGVDALRLDAHRVETVRQLNACPGLSAHFAARVHDQVFAQVVSGAWRLEVIGVWPTQNHDVGFVAPRGDADAAIPQALDALQHAGILDDDARVVEVRAWNLYRKGVRATVMRLERLSPMGLRERDANIAHLLPLVPPAVEQQAKPAKKRRKVKS